MERLTERERNNDGSGISTKSLVVENGMKEGMPSSHCERIVTKLADYEDLEEQGKLLKLPISTGDTVYVLCECGMIPKQLDGTLYDSNGNPGMATGYYCPYEDNCPHDCVECDGLLDCDKFRQKLSIFEDTVKSITLEDESIYISTENCCMYSQIGYSVFLIKEEAIEALKRVKSALELSN